MKTFKKFILLQIHKIKIYFGYRHPEEEYDEYYMGNCKGLPPPEYPNTRVGIFAYSIYGVELPDLVPWFIKRSIGIKPLYPFKRKKK